MIEITSNNSFLNLKDELSQLNINSSFLSYAFHSSLETSGSVGKNTGWVPFPIIAKNQKERLLALCLFFLRSILMESMFLTALGRRLFSNSGLNYYPKMISAIPFSTYHWIQSHCR